MRLTVNRQLRQGYYYVYFEVADFAPDEIKKMESFGVPQINLMWGGGAPGASRVSGKIAITQIGKTYNAAFPNEAEAKNYEQNVLTQIRTAIKVLRESEDKFSSSDEVSL